MWKCDEEGSLLRIRNGRRRIKAFRGYVTHKYLCLLPEKESAAKEDTLVGCFAGNMAVFNALALSSTWAVALLCCSSLHVSMTPRAMLVGASTLARSNQARQVLGERPGGGGGGAVGSPIIFSWGCATGTLRTLTYTRPC